MRKILIVMGLLCICYGFTTPTEVEAAPKKQKENMVVEEEQQKKHRKKSNKSQIECGYVDAIRVAGFVTNAPLGWVNVIPARPPRPETYENDGFGYEVFKKMAENKGMKVKNVGYTSYKEAMSDLRRGKVDVVVGSYFDKRILGNGVNLMFPSYFSNPIVPIFVKGKEKTINTWEDLRGLKGVVRQEENIYSLIFNQLPKDLQIEQVSGAKKAFTKLITGEVDYMLTGLYSGEAEVRRYKLLKEIHFPNKALFIPELFFVFSSHSECKALKKELEPELRKLKANEAEYKQMLIAHIDNWGMRFKDEPGLKEILEPQAKNKETPENNKEIIENSETDITDISEKKSEK